MDNTDKHIKSLYQEVDEAAVPASLSWDKMSTGIYDKMSGKDRRRRGIIWWWIGGSASVLLVTAMVISHAASSHSASMADSSPLPIAEDINTEPLSTKSLSTKHTTTESRSTAHGKDAGTMTASSSRNTDPHTATQTLTQDNIHQAISKATTQHLDLSPPVSVAVASPTGDHRAVSTDHNVGLPYNSITSTTIQDHLPATTTLPPASLSQQISGPDLLFTLPYYLPILPRVLTVDDFDVPPSPYQSKQRHALYAHGGLSGWQGSYSGNRALDRASSFLAGVQGGIGYQRGINDGPWILQVDLDYTMHVQLLQHTGTDQILDTSILIRAVNSLSGVMVRESYRDSAVTVKRSRSLNYYNVIGQAHLRFGIGRQWQVHERWSIVPALQASIHRTIHQSGMTISADGEYQVLSASQPAFTRYGLGLSPSIMLRYALSDQWSIVAMARGGMAVTDWSAGGSTIRPVNVGISIGALRSW